MAGSVGMAARMITPRVAERQSDGGIERGGKPRNSPSLLHSVSASLRLAAEHFPRIGLVERQQATKQLRVKFRQLPRLLKEAFGAICEKLGTVFGRFFVQEHLDAAA